MTEDPVVQVRREVDTCEANGGHVWADDFAVACRFSVAGVWLSVHDASTLLTRDEALVLAEMLRAMACDG